MYSQTDLAHP